MRYWFQKKGKDLLRRMELAKEGEELEEHFQAKEKN
jgi:hypothetical protein